MKYTKGEWGVGYGDTSHAFGVFTKNSLEGIAEDHPICLVAPEHNITNEDKANAKLIAAAPDLVEALREAYKELQFHNWHNTKTGFKIEEAIKKATE